MANFNDRPKHLVMSVIVLGLAAIVLPGVSSFGYNDAASPIQKGMHLFCQFI